MKFNVSQWVLWLKGVITILSLLTLGSVAAFLTPFLVLWVLLRAPGLWRVEVELSLIVNKWRQWGLRRTMEKAGIFISLTSFKPKTIDFRWLQPREWDRVMLRLVRLLGLDSGPWMVFAGRLHSIWLKSGTPFFILYLKECRLALISWANRESYSPNSGCRVRLVPCGLPACVPSGLRPQSLGTSFGRLQFRALHTVFSLYRVMDWRGAIPDFSSITNPFSGVSTVLPLSEIRTALSLFHIPDITAFYGISSPWISTSSGPNHPWSTWSSAKDAVAWALHPIIMMWFIAYTIASRQYLLALWLVSIAHLLVPVAIWLLIRGTVLKLGRLAVLAKDGGGKRRIVGVVDYWSQWALKPLHLYLFSILRGIPQDGTFDQIAPLQSILSYARLGMPSFSFDLSNATDRLPVDLQQQILALIIGPVLARAWKGLMVGRKYSHPRVGDLRYAVGQPIGALSSWAMLALTHHVIVQVAANRAGWKGWFPLYALLGDDIVILREDVAREYLSLMRYLGVPINMTKSIQSRVGLLEFAKRVVSAHHGDLSPVSARLLVTAVRDPRGWLDVWTHMLDLGLILFPNQLLKAIASLSSDVNRAPFKGSTLSNIGLAVVARVFILSRYQEGVVLRPPLPVDEWFRSILGCATLAPLLERAAKLRRIWEIQRSASAERRRAWESAIVFTTQWWRYSLFSGFLGGVLSIPLLVLSPAFWVSLVARWTAVRKLFALSLRFNFLTISEDTEFVDVDPMEVDLKVPDIPVLEIPQVRRPDVMNEIKFWSSALSDTRALAGSRRSGSGNRISQTIIGVSGFLAAPSPSP
jgi:hypothetical protein